MSLGYVVLASFLLQDMLQLQLSCFRTKACMRGTLVTLGVYEKRAFNMFCARDVRRPFCPGCNLRVVSRE